MKNIISFRRAARWSTFLFSLLILIHLGVLVSILVFDYAPLDFLWGGLMETEEQLLRFEVISVVMSGFCLLVILIRSGRINAPGLRAASRGVLWVLVGLFLLNTVGNLLAKTTFEMTFGVITLLLTILCLRMALEPLSNPGTGGS